MFFKHIHSVALTDDNRLSQVAKGHHFKDALSTEISHYDLSPSQLQHAIFAHMPNWVNSLMALRNKIVKVFGFDVGQENMVPESTELNVGDTAGFMKVIEKHQDEIISYAEDRHMAFYLSVGKRHGQVIVTTLVNQKTLLGRLYVNAIVPFHFIIARAVINNAVTTRRI